MLVPGTFTSNTDACIRHRSPFRYHMTYFFCYLTITYEEDTIARKDQLNGNNNNPLVFFLQMRNHIFCIRTAIVIKRCFFFNTIRGRDSLISIVFMTLGSKFVSGSRMEDVTLTSLSSIQNDDFAQHIIEIHKFTC